MSKKARKKGIKPLSADRKKSSLQMFITAEKFMITWIIFVLLAIVTAVILHTTEKLNLFRYKYIIEEVRDVN